MRIQRTTLAWGLYPFILVLFSGLPPWTLSSPPPADTPWEPKVNTLPNNAWQTFHDAHVNITSKGAQETKNPIQVIFYGDSITHLWAWGKQKEVWNKHYAPLGAVNYGIGGDRTENVLWRVQNGGLEKLTNPSPKVVVLCIGTNNIGTPNTTGSDIAKGVKAIVTSLKEKLPNTKVLLLSLFPRLGVWPATFVIDINLRISRMDPRYGNTTDSSVTFLDMTTYFTPGFGHIEEELYIADKLHLSEKGYEKWAEIMEPTLTKLLQ